MLRSNFTYFELKAQSTGCKIIAGIDEVGRGPLAGPVVAVACIFSDSILIDGIDDSKKLSPQKRKDLFAQLDRNAVYGVGIVDNKTIDEINIYQATIRAMLIAVDKLKVKPDRLLVDGLSLPHPQIPSDKIIKGDSKSVTIASASILAKVIRDELMVKYHEQWPDYGFDKHKGYGTKQHMQAIERFGACPIHRRSFEPIKSLRL